MGIGNTLKSDDGFGPALVERIKHKVSCECFDAGAAPENYLGKICKVNPDVVLFVDAADLGEPAGTIKLLKKDEILNCGLTTHDISPAMLMDYLEKNCRAQVFMLAVQPKNLEFGEKLSEEISSALSELEELLMLNLTK